MQGLVRDARMAETWCAVERVDCEALGSSWAAWPRTIRWLGGVTCVVLGRRRRNGCAWVNNNTGGRACRSGRRGAVAMQRSVMQQVGKGARGEDGETLCDRRLDTGVDGMG